MLKNFLNACLIFCVVALAPNAMAAEEISTVEPAQQSEPEKSSRIFGPGSIGPCISKCAPSFGTPLYAGCLVGCAALAVKQE